MTAVSAFFGPDRREPRTDRRLVPPEPGGQAVRSSVVSRRRLILPLAAALLLTACATGERPYFADTAPFNSATPTGDAAIDAVLQKLDSVTAGPVTAAYDILQKFGNTHTAAVVALQPGKRALTFGNVKMIQTETAAVTCTVDGSAPCEDGFLDQRISDTGVTYAFYAEKAAVKLRRLAIDKVGPATASTEQIAGQNTTCVTVPVSGGTAIFCALDDGMLAKQDDASVLVTLQLYGTSVDENTFVLPG